MIVAYDVDVRERVQGGLMPVLAAVAFKVRSIIYEYKAVFLVLMLGWQQS